MSETQRQAGELLHGPVAALLGTKERGNARMRGTQGATSVSDTPTTWAGGLRE
jgi:hypothetical protein